MRYFLCLIMIWMLAMPVLAAGGGGKSGGGACSKDAPCFVDIGAVAVPVIHKGRTRSFNTYILVLEVSDPRAESLVKDNMPRLRDAYFTELFELGSTVDYKKLRDHVYVKDVLLPLTKKTLSGLVPEGEKEHKSEIIEALDSVLVTASYKRRVN